MILLASTINIKTIFLLNNEKDLNNQETKRKKQREKRETQIENKQGRQRKGKRE